MIAEAMAAFAASLKQSRRQQWTGTSRKPSRNVEEISAGLAHGSFGRRIRVGLTVHGSEHGEAEMRRGAALAQGPDLEVVLIEETDAAKAHKRMDAMLDSGELDAAVTMHYSFPIGVSTVGRGDARVWARHVYCLHHRDERHRARQLHAEKRRFRDRRGQGVRKRRANGRYFEPGRRPPGGARAESLGIGGYPIAFTESARADGGVVMRGNDLLQGVPDIMVMDSLTGNAW